MLQDDSQFLCDVFSWLDWAYAWGLHVSLLMILALIMWLFLCTVVIFPFVMNKHLEGIHWDYANILFLKLLPTNFSNLWRILPAKIMIVVSTISFPSWITLADYPSYFVMLKHKFFFVRLWQCTMDVR